MDAQRAAAIRLILQRIAVSAAILAEETRDELSAPSVYSADELHSLAGIAQRLEQAKDIWRVLYGHDD